MEIITLEPHDALPEGSGPEGSGRSVLVLRRFDEDAPRDTVIELRLTGGGIRAESARPTHPNGTYLQWEQAIEAGKAVAVSEKLDRVYVLDRTAGAREQDILQHGGDHSVHMETLQDTDPEDGVTGSDMRDRHI